MRALLLPLSLLLLGQGLPARAEPPTGEESGEPPLRVSLAISGGASKGAYEAGLTWGLLKLLRETSEGPGVAGGQARRYLPASFSGASAGAINTLLSGLAWCSKPEEAGGLADRVDDNVFRDAWIPPDLNRLLPSRADDPLYAEDDAVLARHDMLVGARSLQRQWQRPIFRPGCEIPLGVTVTRVEPERVMLGNVEVENQKFFVPFVLGVGEDRKVSFSFDPEDYPRLTDPDMLLLPGDPKAQASALSDERVLDAIFTSSAFPVAFGRRRLLHCRPRSLLRQSAPPPEAPDLRCPGGYVLAEAEFADGGLFDNLPIGLARRLAEAGREGSEAALPTSYIYVDPHRTRTSPEPDLTAPRDACQKNPALPACREMEFSLGTESAMLLGAVGTARTIQLYQELAGESWRLQLPVLARELADELEGASGEESRCPELQALFAPFPDCPSALRRGAALLELAYEHQRLPIDDTLSLPALTVADLVEDCVERGERPGRFDCRARIPALRERLARTMAGALERLGERGSELARRFELGRASPHADRHILVSSRGVPITGSLLGDFAALLEREFREYDYYAGLYDAVVLTAGYLCERRWSEHPGRRPGSYPGSCLSRTAERLHRSLALERSPRGRYVFALLAKREFGQSGKLAFAYAKMPMPDDSLRIIHQGLEQIRATPASEAGLRPFQVEHAFFTHLKQEGFVPTPIEGGGEPLLGQIMADPDRWAHEITRRMTTRLVLLEKRAAKLYREREPDRKLRQRASPGGIGAAAHALQSATFTYPRLSFAPSTAPEHWYWRYPIPYEIAVDLAEGDILLTWQPTWAPNTRTKVGLRASVGFAGGIIPPVDEGLENYFALGLDLTGIVDLGPISAFGATPMYHRTFFRPDNGRRDGAGFDLHLELLGHRLRLGVGIRNVKAPGETFFVLLGLTDVPGFIYWLTR